MLRFIRPSAPSLRPFLVLGVAFAVAGCQDEPDELPMEESDESALETDDPDAPDARSAQPFVQVADSEEHGEYLVDRNDMPLYAFTPDTAGVSTCYDDCAEAWPPLMEDGDLRVGEPLDETLVDTVEREDGTLQVTYAGMPLYLYAEDEPGVVTGQDVHSHGGEWYLVSPSGEMIHDEDEES